MRSVRRTAAVVVGLMAVIAMPAMPRLAGAEPVANVVSGSLRYQPVGMGYAAYLELDLDFSGAVSIGGAPFSGDFRIAGSTDMWSTRSNCCPPVLTGSYPITGSNGTGDTIAGTCGAPGSSISEVGVTGSAVIVCSASLNGGSPAPLTVTTTHVVQHYVYAVGTGTTWTDVPRNLVGTFS
jgi:hypothetical protein